MSHYCETDYCDFSAVPGERDCALTPYRKGCYAVYASDSADSFDRLCPLGKFSGPCRVPAAATRQYYHIIWEDGRYSVAASRTYNVEGSNNLRELGGYNTADGRCFVRHNVFWRSQRLCEFTPTGLRQLEQLGIKYVLDLRSEYETDNDPDPPLAGAKNEIIPAAALELEDVHIKLDDILDMNDEQLAARGERAYRIYEKVVPKSKALAELFRRMADGDVPLLFHCTAGKDRTGVAAAVILLALGVPKETVMADYLLSRELRSKHINASLEKYKAIGPRGIEVLEYIFSVAEKSLELTFSTIYSSYPTIDEYLFSELDVTPAMLKKIRGSYLVAHEDAL